MAIDILSNHTIKAMPESVATRSSKMTASAKESDRSSILSSPSPDDVVFTAAARTLSQATDIARESDGVDYDKVAYFKQQLEQGTYEIDAEATAEKIIAEHKDLGFILNS